MHRFARPGAALLVACLPALLLSAPAFAHGLVEAAEPATGRPTPGASIALARHAVKAAIDGPVARVEVRQTFRNETDRQLEGTYLFPLPEGAAVSRFAMTMGDRMVEGEVMDAERARAIYEGIVRRRRDPGLLEYVGRGLFRARVFPIEPRGAVDIRLSFEQVLPEDAGTLEFRYPLATARLHGQPVEETVVTVDVASEVPVRAVYSPSHEVATVQADENHVHASYEAAWRRQERDFLLYVVRSADEVAFTMLDHKEAGQDGTFLAVLAPATRPTQGVVPKDVIFVLDVSGSMNEDDKIDQARRALGFGLGVLRPEDRFGIVTFSTVAHRFRDTLLSATPEHRDAARAWLADRPANGGTNLLAGLRRGLDLADPERLTIAVLLSDGRPTVGAQSSRAVLDGLEGKVPARTRVFTFGVGHDLDVQLMDLIAERTGGARDYVAPREELEIATSRFFRKVVDPVLTDVALDLGEGIHDVYPPELPDLFSGGRVVVMGRYAKTGPRTITLSGRVGDREVTHVYAANLGADERAPYLPRMWANRKVAFLLDAIRLHGEDAELVDEVKRLGVAYGIVTPYTAGLVTDDAELERAGRRGPVPTTPAALPRARGGGGGGQYRGPGGSVPPGLREPTDPTPAPAPPPSGPPSTPTPSSPSTPHGPPPATATAPRPTNANPSAPPPAPKDAVGASEALDEAKRADVADEATAVRRVAGRTFLRKGERWVESTWDEKTKPERIVFLSEAWTALTREDSRLAKILALGEHVLFVWEGKAYEVVPAPDEAAAPTTAD